MSHLNENPAVMLMKDFCKHHNSRNLEGLLSLFCREHQVHIFGTGVDEERNGLEAIKEQVIRDWEQSEKSVLIAPDKFYFSENPVSWAAGDFTAEVTVKGQTMTVPHLRASFSVI